MNRLQFFVAIAIVLSAPVNGIGQNISFTVSPTSVQLSNGVSGGGTISTKVTVSNNVASSYTIAATATTRSGGNWLSASVSINPLPMRGTSTITITADPKQLGPGTYDGNINVSGNGTSVSVPVTFTVTQPARLTITTAQNDLPAGNLTSSYSFFLLASGGVPPYSWSVISGALPDGLRLNSATGEISGTPKVVGAIKPFQFTVQLKDSLGATATVTYSLNVFGTPTLTVTSPLTFSSTAGAASAPQTLHITANTIDPITFALSPTSYAKGSGWLTSASTSSPFDYTLVANASGLGVDSYSATLLVSCVGQACNQSPALVKVLFNVSSISLSVSTFELDFQVLAGTVSTAKTLSVSSSSGSTVLTFTSEPWIRVTSSANTVSSMPVTLSVSVDASSLSVARHTGSIILSCGGTICSTAPITVVADVTSPSLSVNPTNLTFQATTPNGRLPDRETVNIAASSPQGFGFTYTPQGSWLQVTANQTTTPAVLTVNIVSIPPQSSSGSITITPSGGSGASPIIVTVALNVSAALPFISSIVTATDFGAFTVAAPGTYVEIYGSSLSSTNPGRVWEGRDFTNNGRNAPTSLDGTKVSVGGRDAFVYFISPGQINALIPSDVLPPSAQVTVTNAAGTSNAYTLALNPVQPGFLASAVFKVATTQYAAALNADGSFAIPTGAVTGIASHPAAPGDILTIYGLGFGGVVPAIPAGTVVSQLNTLALPLVVRVGGLLANTTYQGLAGGYTGLYQINVQVPQVTGGDAVPLTFDLGGTPGRQILNIAVRP